MGRRITKEEAMDILRRTEDAGLVHATENRQEIDFLLVERSGIPAPPVDQKALSQAVKAAVSSSGAAPSGAAS